MAKDHDPRGKHPNSAKHRFKKGETHSKGRHKGSLGVKTTFLKGLMQLVKVTENGKPRTCTKLQLTVEQAMSLASKGNPKALDFIKAISFHASALEQVEYHRGIDEGLRNIIRVHEIHEAHLMDMPESEFEEFKAWRKEKLVKQSPVGGILRMHAEEDMRKAEEATPQDEEAKSKKD